ENDLAQEGGESALVLLDPRLDVVEAMVPLRDDEEEPDGQHFAWGERAFPVQRGGEMAVQDGGQIQTLQGGPQDGEVGHDFDTQQTRFGGVHPSSLLTPPIPENHPKHERTVCSGVEAITVTEHMNFNVGNAMKYLWRSEHKNGLEDLKKALWYVS